MTPSKHLLLLSQAVAVWIAFWVAGLPRYFQQYSPQLMGVGCTLLSVAISLAALWVLLRVRPERRRMWAGWLSFYYTVPFALLDTLYCGMYLGHGPSYLVSYWYLTVFYVTPWLTFVPTARLLDAASRPIQPAMQTVGGADRP
jgi:hypothetical protein